MTEMYDVALDGYGPPLEPPDDYYFLPQWEQEQEDADDDE